MLAALRVLQGLNEREALTARAKRSRVSLAQAGWWCGGAVPQLDQRPVVGREPEADGCAADRRRA